VNHWPDVEAFGIVMRQRLATMGEATTWRQIPASVLVESISDELRHLRKLCAVMPAAWMDADERAVHGARIIYDAASIANLAMMIAELAREAASDGGAADGMGREARAGDSPDSD
jgi:hypothetical protein